MFVEAGSELVDDLAVGLRGITPLRKLANWREGNIADQAKSMTSAGLQFDRKRRGIVYKRCLYNESARGAGMGRKCRLGGAGFQHGAEGLFAGPIRTGGTCRQYTDKQDVEAYATTPPTRPQHGQSVAQPSSVWGGDVWLCEKQGGIGLLAALLDPALGNKTSHEHPNLHRRGIQLLCELLTGLRFWGCGEELLQP